MDIKRIREDFPILNVKVNERPLLYFDNAATTQVPEPVLKAMEEQYHFYQSNVHRGVHSLSEASTRRLEEAREELRSFINAAYPEEIIFTSGTTASINTVALSLEQLFTPGDEIMTTVMEHHSNLLPWQELCRRRNGVLKTVPVLPDGSLDMGALERLLTSRTWLLAVTCASNVSGCVNPVKDIIAMAHSAGALVLLDAAQIIRHSPVDVQELDCDFLCFSGHKMLGPTGTGVLYGKREVLESLPPVFTGGGMVESAAAQSAVWEAPPYRFEAGTGNIAGDIGLGAAAAYIKRTGRENICAREEQLMELLVSELEKRSYLTVYGELPRRSGAVGFNFKKLQCFDGAKLLDSLGAALRSGHHCAQPYVSSFGVEGMLRVSPAFYNTEEEVEQLMWAMDKVAARFC